MKKELISWLMILSLQFVWIVPCMYGSQNAVAEDTESTEIEIVEDIIRWKEESTEEITEVNEVDIIPEQVEVVTNASEIKFYDVPLSEELQLYIFEECEKHNIAPAIIIAMIERESDFDASNIGDNGKSIGLMQIQPKWHTVRMDRLGCTNLLDPFQNVKVGIDYVAELKDKNPDLYWVLMAYNGGPDYATRKINACDYSDYALEVVEQASKLERSIE